MSELARAAEAFNAGRFPEAERRAGAALRAGEDAASALLFRGMARLAAGRRAAALRDLRRAERLRPGCAREALAAAARPGGTLARRAAAAEERGRFAEAERLWRRAASEERDAKAAAAAARLRLWRGDWAAALRAPDPLCRGAALVGLGRAREALRPLSEAARAEPARPEPWLWRAMALRALGRRSEAALCARQAARRTPSSWAAAALLQLLALEAGRAPDRAALTLAASRLGLDARGRAALLDGGAARRRALLAALLRRARGNLGDPPTRVRAGRLERVAPTPTRREEPTRAQALVLSRGPEAAAAALRALARGDGRGQALSHLGELRLWQGRWKEAGALLRRALAADPRVRWPRVGLAACELLQGRPEAALAALARASDAGAVEAVVLPWRAEALLEAGRPGALAECRRAARLFPRRPSALVDLALAFGAARRAGPRDALLRLLEREAPEWLARARAKGGGPDAVLRAARALMRGNRSSWLPFYWDRGRPRRLELSDAAAREAARLLARP